MKKSTLVTIFLLASSTCFAGGDSESADSPTPKDIIKLIVQDHATALDEHPSCHGVGTQLSDKTIGDYLSGFLAEFTHASGINSFEFDSEKSAGQWKVRFMIRRNHLEEQWAWGVSFVVNAEKTKIIKGSLRCLGAG